MLYEEIYLKSPIFGGKENLLKAKIGQVVDQIKPNPLHAELLSLPCENFLTTNYDFILEKGLDPSLSNRQIKNQGIIRETKFSLFRHSKVKGKNIWHLHGAINKPRSINLGFEHYGGQLQLLRNYVVNGTNYTSNRISKIPLHRRLEKSNISYDSWVDYFFLSDVHIVGLKLGFEETDLWWLLTDRARFFLSKGKLMKNNIYYYCPTRFKEDSKIALMKGMGIKTVLINKSGKKYYREVIKLMRRKMKKR